VDDQGARSLNSEGALCCLLARPALSRAASPVCSLPTSVLRVVTRRALTSVTARFATTTQLRELRGAQDNDAADDDEGGEDGF
jgi:hypothetical protein